MLKKLTELTNPQLKAELLKLGLPTTGNKNELQVRLRGAMEERDLNPEAIDVGEENGAGAAAPLDMAEVLKAIQEAAKEQREAIRKLEEASLKREMATREQQQAFATKIEEAVNKLQLSVDVKVADVSHRLEEQKVELSGLIHEKVQTVEEKIRDVDKGLREDVAKELEKMKADIERPGAVVREIGAVPKLKPPTFDGKSSFVIFRLQFEAAAEKNRWDNEDKATALMLALRGEASEVLKTLPSAAHKNYDLILATLQRRYGEEHKQDLFRIELRNRKQKPGESLQQLAADIERLAHQSYPTYPAEYLEGMMIEVFTGAVRDPDIQKALLLAQKHVYTEAVACAMAHEAAALSTGKTVTKIRRVDVQPAVAEEKDGVHETLKEVLKVMQAIQDGKQSSGGKQNSKGRPRCFNCGTIGHLSRDCRKRRQRSPIPTEATSKDTPAEGEKGSTHSRPPTAKSQEN